MQMTDQGVAQEAPAREGSSGRQEGTGQEGRRGWAQRGGSGALVDPALGAGITSWHSGEVASLVKDSSAGESLYQPLAMGSPGRRKDPRAGQGPQVAVRGPSLSTMCPQVQGWPGDPWKEVHLESGSHQQPVLTSRYLSTMT